MDDVIGSDVEDDGSLLEPPGITAEEEHPDDSNPFKNAYTIFPEDLVKRYTDPARVTELIQHLEEKVYENGILLTSIKSTLIDLKRQLNKVQVGLEEITPVKAEPPPRDTEEGINVVLRAEWGALPSKTPDKVPRLTLPIKKVNFTFNTQTESCETSEECIKQMQSIQKRDMLKGLPDIAHNFLIGEDGNVYEGRGWYLKPAVAAGNATCQDETIDIAYIGDFTSDTYPFELLEQAVDLIDSGIKKNLVSKDYKML